MVKIEPRKLVLIDSSCALAGGVFYYVLFDFLLAQFSLPRALLQSQLLANGIYGVYGAIVFISGSKSLRLLQFLMRMNFIYAALCVLSSGFLIFSGLYLGALLLFIEALLIAGLAQVERTVWK